MTQPANFGFDLSCLFDFTNSFGTVSGVQLLSEALVRRISSPSGSLFYDPNYGFDVTQMVQDDLSPADVAAVGQRMDHEFQKDQRVQSSYTTATFLPVDGIPTLTTTTTINRGSGPFTLVLSINNVTVQILQAQYQNQTPGT